MSGLHTTCQHLHGCTKYVERLGRATLPMGLRIAPKVRVAAALVDTTSYVSAQGPHPQSQTTPTDATDSSWNRWRRNELPERRPPAATSVQQLLRAASASWVLAGAAVVLLPLLLLYRVADQCSSFLHGGWCLVMQAPVGTLGSSSNRRSIDANSTPTTTNSSRTPIPGGSIHGRNSAGRQTGPGSPSCFPLIATLFLGLLCSVPLLVVSAQGPPLQPWLRALGATILLELVCLMVQPCLLRHGAKQRQEQQQQQQQGGDMQLAWAGANNTFTYPAAGQPAIPGVQHAPSSSSRSNGRGSSSSVGEPQGGSDTGGRLPVSWWLCQAGLVCISTLRCWLLLQLALRAGSAAAGAPAAFVLGCCLCSQVGQLATWAQ